MTQLLTPLQSLSPLQWAALINAFAACFLTGLIWTIQHVHYPLFAWIPPNAFTGEDLTHAPNNQGYEPEHIKRITRIVGPLMLIEGIASIALVALAPAELRTTAIALLIMLAAIWISTATTQGPLHLKIAQSADRTLIRKLVNTNWLRTALWTARALTSLALIPALF